MTQRFATNIGFSDTLNIQSTLYTGFDTIFAQCILKSQRIHQRGEHPHVVALGALHTG